MNKTLTRLRDEPVLLTTLVQSALTLLVVFGLDLSTEQNVAILGVTTALLAIFARSKVTPTKALEELAAADEAIDDFVEDVADEDTLDGHAPQI